MLDLNYRFHLWVLIFVLICILASSEFYFKTQAIKISSKWWFPYFLTSFILLIFLLYIDIIFRYFSYTTILPDGVSNILAELHGFLFDILIVTFVLDRIKRKKEEKSNINNLISELDEYKYWNTEDASFKKIFLIKNLIKNGEIKIQLLHHFFLKGQFRDIDYNILKFKWVTLDTCSFAKGNSTNNEYIIKNAINSNFNDISFNYDKFNLSTFNDCYFSKCSFIECVFEFSELSKCKFISCTFLKCRFINTKLEDCWFWGTLDFTDCDFDKTNLNGVCFPNLRANELQDNLEKWLGAEKTKTQIYNQYRIVNFDDPSPLQIPHHPILHPVPFKVKKPGCVLRPIIVNPYRIVSQIS